jgi:hypothetical protein
MKTEKAINDLRIDVGALRTDMNARFDSMRSDMYAGFDSLRSDMYARCEKTDEKIDGNFKATVTLFLTAMGIVLAAFYAFVSYMVK